MQAYILYKFAIQNALNFSIYLQKYQNFLIYVIFYGKMYTISLSKDLSSKKYNYTITPFLWESPALLKCTLLYGGKSYNNNNIAYKNKSL